MLKKLFDKFKKNSDNDQEQEQIDENKVEEEHEVESFFKEQADLNEEPLIEELSDDEKQERMNEKFHPMSNEEKTLEYMRSEEPSYDDYSDDHVDYRVDEFMEIEKAVETADVENELEEYSEDLAALEEVEEQEQLGFFDRLKKGLSKTRNNISGKIDQILASTRKVDEELFEELEETLISADLGVESTLEIMDQLRDLVKRKNIKDPLEIKKELIDIMKQALNKDMNNKLMSKSPTIILVVGVNGVGKTTTIGKIASKLKHENKKVMLVAADTFRAAAIEQLTEWSQRAQVPIISHREGADPASVIFDGIQSAKAKKVDVLICDTAGRLHNKKNLMNELNKIKRVIEREYSNANFEALLVVDGTTGQNALLQAKEFNQATDLTGVVITKLDGTAKGGVIFPLQMQMKIPVKLIGVGEQIEDLMEFNADRFVEAIIN